MADRPKKRESLLGRIRRLYPSLKPIVFEAINTRDMPKLPQQSGGYLIGCTLSHRTIVQDAKARGCKNILVLEEDAHLHRHFDYYLKRATDEIDMHDVKWGAFYLGACVWGNSFVKITPTLETIKGCTCTHGIAYHENFFNEILDSIPDNKQDVFDFLRKERAIDQWLLKYQREGKAVMCSPRIVSQPFLIGADRQDSEDDFIY